MMRLLQRLHRSSEPEVDQTRLPGVLDEMSARCAEAIANGTTPSGGCAMVTVAPLIAASIGRWRDRDGARFLWWQADRLHDVAV